MECRRNRADGSVTQFHPHESGNTKQEKDEKENQKGGIDGKNGCGENTGKREHREKERVAVRDSAIEAGDGDENQKMHHSQKGGE